MGLEVAVPVTDGGGGTCYVDIVPLSTSGTWGDGVIHYVGAYDGPIRRRRPEPGNIVAADFNGAGKPSIALDRSGTGQIEVLLADLASNQFLPVETVQRLVVEQPSACSPWRPSWAHAATVVYRGPTSDPSTLVHNSNGTWTRTYPDGTVIQFNSSGQETSESDRNGNTFTYAYVTSGAAAGALATITDPVGLITTLTYNSSGYLSTITDPADRVTTFTVDSHDNLTEIVDPDGAITDVRLLDALEPRGHHRDRPRRQHRDGPLQQLRPVDQRDALRRHVDDRRSTRRRPTACWRPGGSGSLSTAYEGSVTDPDGHTTTLTFNWMSHPTGEVDATGGTTTTTYNSRASRSPRPTPMGRTITYTYDSTGDVTSITEPYVAIRRIGVRRLGRRPRLDRDDHVRRLVRRAHVDHRLQRQHHHVHARLARQRARGGPARRRRPGVDLQFRRPGAHLHRRRRGNHHVHV